MPDQEARGDEPTTEQLLADAQSREGNRCRICDEPAHFRVEHGRRGHFSCVQHVQLTIEDVIEWSTGVRLSIEPASRYERIQARKG